MGIGDYPTPNLQKREFISDKEKFKDACNEILKIENAGYRFVGDNIMQITSEEEIAEIELAMSHEVSFGTVSTHIKSALEFLTDKKVSDNSKYRNSIKESISAVESMCKLITGDERGTLGQMLDKIEKDGLIDLHKSLKNAFKNLYSYTNDADGIRHALKEKSDLDYEDARFMLISCSAFVNYLKEKISKSSLSI